jgi:hypothetical protein
MVVRILDDDMSGTGQLVRNGHSRGINEKTTPDRCALVNLALPSGTRPGRYFGMVALTCRAPARKVLPGTVLIGLKSPHAYWNTREATEKRES